MADTGINSKEEGKVNEGKQFQQKMLIIDPQLC